MAPHARSSRPLRSAVIAMGFPSTGLEGSYRNPAEEVQRFFSKFHPNAFKVYNLCAERIYEPSVLSARLSMVAHYPFDDHNPPCLEMIGAMCEDMRRVPLPRPPAESPAETPFGSLIAPSPPCLAAVPCRLPSLAACLPMPPLTPSQCAS